MKKKLPRLVKKKPSNVVRLPGSEPPEEVLQAALDHVLDPGSNVTHVVVGMYDSKTGFEFSSTSMNPETHCIFSMELEQRVRHAVLTQYATPKPDGNGS